MASELGRSSRGAAYSMSCSTTVMATCPSEHTRVLKPVTSACTACESHSVEIFSQSAGTSAAAHASSVSQRELASGREGCGAPTRLNLFVMHGIAAFGAGPEH